MSCCHWFFTPNLLHCVHHPKHTSGFKHKSHKGRRCYCHLAWLNVYQAPYLNPQTWMWHPLTEILRVCVFIRPIRVPQSWPNNSAGARHPEAAWRVNTPFSCERISSFVTCSEYKESLWLSGNFQVSACLASTSKKASGIVRWKKTNE